MILSTPIKIQLNFNTNLIVFKNWHNLIIATFFLFIFSGNARAVFPGTIFICPMLLTHIFVETVHGSHHLFSLYIS